MFFSTQLVSCREMIRAVLLHVNTWQDFRLPSPHHRDSAHFILGSPLTPLLSPPSLPATKSPTSFPRFNSSISPDISHNLLALFTVFTYAFKLWPLALLSPPQADFHRTQFGLYFLPKSTHSHCMSRSDPCPIPGGLHSIHHSLASSLVLPGTAFI